MLGGVASGLAGVDWLTTARSMDPRRVPVTTKPRLPSSNRITLSPIQSRGDSIEHQPLVLYIIFHLSVNTATTLLVTMPIEVKLLFILG